MLLLIRTMNQETGPYASRTTDLCVYHRRRPTPTSYSVGLRVPASSAQRHLVPQACPKPVLSLACPREEHAADICQGSGSSSNGKKYRRATRITEDALMKRLCVWQEIASSLKRAIEIMRNAISEVLQHQQEIVAKERSRKFPRGRREKAIGENTGGDREYRGQSGICT